MDSETYPVAASIATLWYEGDPSKSTVERWAFAVSAKAKWKSKIDSDVEKIVATGRPYTLVYFISNQAIRDKDRAETEDALKVLYGSADFKSLGDCPALSQIIHYFEQKDVE